MHLTVVADLRRCTWYAPRPLYGPEILNFMHFLESLANLYVGNLAGGLAPFLWRILDPPQYWNASLCSKTSSELKLSFIERWPKVPLWAMAQECHTILWNHGLKGNQIVSHALHLYPYQQDTKARQRNLQTWCICFCLAKRLFNILQTNIHEDHCSSFCQVTWLVQ